MTSSALHARLLDDARSYNPAAHHRSLLDPFRDVILVQRAKFMSYEQIAGTFARNGIKVSGPGVASYCRRTFALAEILRMREQLRNEARLTPGAKSPAPMPAAVKPDLPALLSKQSPKVARDHH